jgi:hypothetical protein
MDMDMGMGMPPPPPSGTVKKGVSRGLLKGRVCPSPRRYALGGISMGGMGGIAKGAAQRCDSKRSSDSSRAD